jgi:hypothetical protein
MDYGVHKPDGGQGGGIKKNKYIYIFTLKYALNALN